MKTVFSSNLLMLNLFWDSINPCVTGFENTPSLTLPSYKFHWANFHKICRFQSNRHKITVFSIGWVNYGRQKSPQSILLGNRILYASIALLPTTFFWFYSSFFMQRPTRLTWTVTGLSLILGFFGTIRQRA